jgi:hypothetical protein
VIDDLHRLARVHAGEIGQDLEAQIQGVVERAQHLRHAARLDADLGLVVALVDRSSQVTRPGGLRAGP